jgi:hypothetical protein
MAISAFNEWFNSHGFRCGEYPENLARRAWEAAIETKQAIDVKTETGDLEMNEKTKVIDAINHYETQRKDVETKRQMLGAASVAEKEAETDLVRTLKAVYGGRAAKGVVLRGKKYSAVQVCTSGAHELQVVEAEFEVLG